MNGALPPVKCLIVDDLEENLLALGALLRQDGVELLMARSASAALELLLVHDVALALLDVQMPDMDGFQLAELMRGSERTRSIPIIFVTAGVHEPHRVFKGYESGAVDFLHKPVDARILANKAGVFFQLYRQKLQLAQQLEERTRTLHLNEMFVAILGHDLRTPLNTILASAEVLERASDPATVQEVAARMRSSGRRMQTLIENVLDLARARLGGGIGLSLRPADLGALLASTMQEFHAIAPERRFDLDCRGDLTGHWDPDRLTQVLSNLIGNALQHGDALRPIRVELDGTQAEGVQLSVINDGSIPPESLQHVFDPFAAARRQRARNEGLGLGLYIVRQIVEAHGGQIDARVDEGRRTVFSLVLPRSPSTDTGTAAPRAEKPLTPVAAPAAASSRRILVVDDNRDSADSLAILLELDGNQIRTAYDGVEAVEVAAAFRPDVVVLDLGLPRLDGFEAAQQIRAQPWGRDMVLVALTGWDQNNDRRRSAEAGFDRHLVKPVDGTTLLQMLSGLTRP